MKVPDIAAVVSDFALTRQQLMALGVVLFLIGTLEIVGTFFIMNSVTTHRAAAAAAAVAQAQECKSRLTNLGFQVTTKGDQIDAQMSGLSDAAYKLGQASIASLSCQGWKLAKFCMGEGCEGKGISLELAPANSDLFKNLNFPKK